ncbi:MAG: hypothetical protein N2111_08755 [Candidatus Sumerlaeaceae bacterium]|nr:hypothetical protein [Candidatus Sumerlaeaceae bacterium]
MLGLSASAEQSPGSAEKTKSVELSRGERVSRLLVEGHRAFREGNFALAQSRFEEALTIDDRNAEARRFLGQIEQKRGVSQLAPAAGGLVSAASTTSLRPVTSREVAAPEQASSAATAEADAPTVVESTAQADAAEAQKLSKSDKPEPKPEAEAPKAAAPAVAAAPATQPAGGVAAEAAKTKDPKPATPKVVKRAPIAPAGGDILPDLAESTKAAMKKVEELAAAANAAPVTKPASASSVPETGKQAADVSASESKGAKSSDSGSSVDAKSGDKTQPAASQKTEAKQVAKNSGETAKKSAEPKAETKKEPKQVAKAETPAPKEEVKTAAKPETKPRNPIVEADTLFRQAQKELADGRRDQALATVRRALDLDPLNVEAKALAEELSRPAAKMKTAASKSAATASPQSGDVVLAALDDQKPARGGAAPEPASGAGSAKVGESKPAEAKPADAKPADAVPVTPPPPAPRTTRRAAGKATSSGEAEAAFQKGLVAYESGRLDVAVQWWNYALTLQPGHQRAIDYLTMTRADYDAWVQQHQYNAIELQKEADSSGKLASPITYDTAGQKSIVEFLSAVSLITDVSFYVTDGVDPEIRVTAKFDQTPLADALDIVLLPIGLKWTRSGDVVTVTPDLRTKFFNLSPDQVSRLKTVLETKTLQRLLYGPEGVPPMRNTELLLDDRQNTLIVTDSQENINKVEAFLKDMQVAGPPALVYRSWKIKPEEGNKIKALVEAVIRVQSDAPYDLERKVVVDGEDLIVKDTAENIARIEELLLDKNFIKKLETQTLKVATFNLTPRTPLSENLEQTRDLAQNIVTVVKTILYSQSTESAAAAEGRRYWYDPNTLQLTITDYPENLQVVSDYIRSLPIFEQKLKSEIVFLKHQTAEDLANLIRQVLGLEEAAGTGARQTGNSVTKTLRVEGELAFRDLRIRVTRVNENDAADKNDDSVDLVVRTPTTSEDRTIEEFRSEFIDDYEVNVIEVRPSGTPGEGSARIEVRYNPAATGLTGGGLNQGVAGPAGGAGAAGAVTAVDPLTGLPVAEPTQTAAETGLTIDTISNMNALLIRYQDPGELAQVKSWIEQLDIPVLQVSIETKLVEVNERRAKEYLPEFSIANLGQGVSLADNVLNSRFAQYADEFRDPFDPFPEDPFSGGLLKGTTVLDFTSIGESPVNFTLRMLETEGVLNVVNGPLVTVENGENASFQIEKFFGALPQLQVGGTGTSGQGFVQSLQQVDFEVTPQITQLGEIRLEIQNLVLQDFGNEGGVESVIDVDGNGAGDPYEPTAIARSLTYDRRRRSLETVARVKDGGTIVLGGWTGERTTQSDSGVPILRQIPYIGKLFFNRTADRVDKTTLLIFLTCHIVKP